MDSKPLLLVQGTKAIWGSWQTTAGLRVFNFTGCVLIRHLAFSMTEALHLCKGQRHEGTVLWPAQDSTG